jgi:methionyl-tRNA formyltransferase
MLFGGSRLLCELSLNILKDNIYGLIVYTSDRQLKDVIYPDGTTLKDFLKKNNIDYSSESDINKCFRLKKQITPYTLGIGLGEAWSFSKELIDLFDGRLLDFMGIRLPKYRGGAHYTWQILKNDKRGGCNLQIINEDMVQGEFDSGEIVKSEDYNFPKSARIPDDYFEFAVKKEILFIKKFFKEVTTGKDFKPVKLREDISMYFPRLNTLLNGLIDWSWDTKDIESFICAFDDPYAGASTYISGRKVFLKKCKSDFKEGKFHPFQSGLIYKIYKGKIFVASKSGTLVIGQVLDEKKRNILQDLKVGQRLFTPIKYLEDARQTEIKYSAKGIK